MELDSVAICFFSAVGCVVVVLAAIVFMGWAQVAKKQLDDGLWLVLGLVTLGFFVAFCVCLYQAVQMAGLRDGLYEVKETPAPFGGKQREVVPKTDIAPKKKVEFRRGQDELDEMRRFAVEIPLREPTRAEYDLFLMGPPAPEPSVATALDEALRDLERISPKQPPRE